MPKAQQHSPTLNTVLMVERALEDCGESAITVAGLKRILPKQVNHSTLMTVLEYLERSGKIAVSLKGMTWMAGNTGTPLLRKHIKSGMEL